jgi:hypothetical protein
VLVVVPFDVESFPAGITTCIHNNAHLVQGHEQNLAKLRVGDVQSSECRVEGWGGVGGICLAGWGDCTCVVVFLLHSLHGL